MEGKPYRTVSHAEMETVCTIKGVEERPSMTFTEDLSLVPRIHTSWLTTTWNSSSGELETHSHVHACTSIPGHIQSVRGHGSESIG